MIKFILGELLALNGRSWPYMKNHHLIEKIAFILLIIGGLNWGLVGLFRLDLIGSIFGMMSGLSRIIYVLVGLAAVYRLIMWFKARAK